MRKTGVSFTRATIFMNKKFSFIAHRCRYYRTNDSMILFSLLRQNNSKNGSTVGKKSSRNYHCKKIITVFNIRGIYLFFIFSIFYLINRIFFDWSVYLL